MTFFQTRLYGMRSRGLSAMVLGAVLLIALPLAARADTDFYARDVARIETRAKTEPDAARAEAATLRQELHERIRTEQEFADGSGRQADQWRDLVAGARADAKHNRERADHFRKEARDPILSEASRADINEWVAQYERDAAADDERAEGREENAARLRKESQERLNKVATLERLVARLEAAFADPQDEPAVAADTQDAPTDTPSAAAGDASAKAKWRVEDVLGIWRPVTGAQFPFVIVQQDPAFEAYPNRIEVHTDKRVWKGNYTSFPEGHPGRSQAARMVLTYTPQPREMNPKIPDWVTAAIDGHLKWRLEIDQMGTRVQPRLRVKWYRGEVRWTEGDEAHAWIESDGTPLIFELEFETLLDLEQMSAASLWLEPHGPSKPVFEQMTSVLKRQPFKVKVRLPPALAAQAGPKIKVDIKGLTGGDTQSLTLDGPVVSTGRMMLRPVVYTHAGEIVIGDWGSEPDLDPPVGSVQWVSDFYARTSEKGKRIGLDIENKEVVEFRYGGTFQQIAVYNNWMTRGLDQQWSAALAYRQGFGKTVSDNTVPDAPREEATRGLRLVQNYFALVSQESLLDIHKFYLGQLYVGGGVDGIKSLCSGEECGLLPLSTALVRVSVDDLGKMSRVVSPVPTRNAYFTKLVENFVETLTGRKTDPVAVRMRNAVNWTSPAEQQMVAMALAGASEDMRHIFQQSVGQTVYAIPKTLAEDLKIIVFGKDLKDRPISGWQRDVTAARTLAQLLLNAAQPALVRGIDKLRANALTRLGAPSRARSLIRVRGSQERAVQSAVDTSGAGGATVRLVDDMPGTLNDAQIKQTSLKLEADNNASRGPRCARPKMRADGEAVEIDLAALNKEATAKSLYGPDATYEGTQLRPPQQGGTCVAVTGDYLINKRTGADMGEAGVLIEASQSASEVLSNALVGSGVRDLNRRLQFTRVAGKSPTQILQEMFDDGVPLRVMRHVLRQQGADVGIVPIERNGRTNLRHVKAALDRDYDVMLAVDLSEMVGEANSFHSIAVVGFQTQGGQIVRVRFFEPNVGGIVSVPLPQFERLIARTAADGSPLAFSNMMVVKWDAREWSGNASTR